jgi:hypothetical protein
MHIGDPSFAAQLQPQSGDPVNFDDPGCLFLYLDEHSPEPGTVYFRHQTEDRWLDDQEVAFLLGVERTPMGFGLAATSASDTGARSLADARDWLRERQREAR